MTYKLSNRRYIGSKTSLLNNILSFLEEENISFSSVADLFAGTGVVSEYFLRLGKKVVVNDILYSNYVCYNAWLSDLPYRKDVVQKFLDLYNSTSLNVETNYFSDTFSGTYFHVNDACKIGSIREHLEAHKRELLEREYYILLASLLYTTDKIANTVGHFESFLSAPPISKGVTLQPLELYKYKFPARIYQQDANSLASAIQVDLVYLDPPYNARQYINFYHVLENLAEWKKPKVYGKTLKMLRSHKKSNYSTSKASLVFADLVEHISAKTILVSYSNTYNAKSESSNNKITEREMVDILSARGTVSKKEIPHRFFNSGKTVFENHREYLYLCKVDN